jgi:hypothetical protein
MIALVWVLYVWVRSRSRTSKDTWEMLPRVEKSMEERESRAEIDESSSPEGEIASLPCTSSSLELEAGKPVEDDNFQSSSSENLIDLSEGEDTWSEVSEDLIIFDADRPDPVDGPRLREEMFPGGEDLEEAFHDAVDSPVLIVSSSQYESAEEVWKKVTLDNGITDIPEGDEEVPDRLPLPASTESSLVRRPLQMGEMSPDSPPTSRPRWSLRASDAPSLGLVSSSSARPSSAEAAPNVTLGTIPGSLPESPTEDMDTAPLEVSPSSSKGSDRSSAAAAFDMALAMQLRPGFGVGADAAWMVRFLMAIFGWFTVLLSRKRGG